jgi:thymidylate synthase (FAD)
MTTTPSVSLLWITNDAEQQMAYAGQVSGNYHHRAQDYTNLFRYLIGQRRWSSFEMAGACFEIVTTRGLAAEIMRHDSFAFQERSQRYPACPAISLTQARRDDNRPVADDVQAEWLERQLDVHQTVRNHYQWATDHGIARECAQTILPMASVTALIMSGSIGAWIRYVSACDETVIQPEQRQIADAVREILDYELPVLSEILEWGKKCLEQNQN